MTEGQNYSVEITGQEINDAIQRSKYDPEGYKLGLNLVVEIGSDVRLFGYTLRIYTYDNIIAYDSASFKRLRQNRRVNFSALDEDNWLTNRPESFASISGSIQLDSSAKEQRLP